MAAHAPAAPRAIVWDVFAWTLRTSFRPLQVLLVAPSILFLATMALMLFHPPDYRIHSYDRFAFVLLIFVVVLRACVLRQPLRVTGAVVWPMAALTALALCGVLAQPYDPETWSMFAAKWAVPFALYLLSGYVFENQTSLRQFELFALVVLAYLSLTAVFSMAGARDIVFPRYILDESLGMHADRARGPFLQAVANGVALNLLGLLALDSFRRKQLRGPLAILMLAALPFAIMATKTRAVWLSFAASILLLPVVSNSRRLRRASLSLAGVSLLGLLALLNCADHQRSLSERFDDSGPVMFRMSVYRAGWEMFLQKPLAGWAAPKMQAELSRRISEFRQEQYYFHNTYLEVLVQHGLIGLTLYLWLVIGLFRVGQKQNTGACSADGAFLDEEFRSLWPLLLFVYFVNGSFVVMNYQFVNALLFTLAGLLAAQNRRPTTPLPGQP